MHQESLPTHSFFSFLVVVVVILYLRIVFFFLWPLCQLEVLISEADNLYWRIGAIGGTPGGLVYSAECVPEYTIIMMLNLSLIICFGRSVVLPSLGQEFLSYMIMENYQVLKILLHVGIAERYGKSNASPVDSRLELMFEMSNGRKKRKLIQGMHGWFSQESIWLLILGLWIWAPCWV